MRPSKNGYKYERIMSFGDRTKFVLNAFDSRYIHEWKNVNYV